MDLVIITFLSLFILTFSYLYKSKTCKCSRFVDRNLVRASDIEKEKERLTNQQFDIEFRKYKMSR